MNDILDTLAEDAKETVESGYYKTNPIKCHECSFRKSIIESEKAPIITEIKLSSPSKSDYKKINILNTAEAMIRGGATCISILTEPKHFKGSLNHFKIVREKTSVPLLMKDFIVSKTQIETASNLGANAILMIQTLFDRNYCDSSREVMIEQAHSKNIEVLLETHTENEFQRALKSNADLIGINNRDLRTLKVDLNTTTEILRKYSDLNKTIVSESGIETPADIIRLRSSGANAFLVGTAVISASNVENKVRELVEA
ncbi:indole-3-glycerol-phosphate synthase [[Eubacterium] cellulosolvens]